MRAPPAVLAGALLAGLGALTTPAAAQRGFYAGAAGGESEILDACEVLWAGGADDGCDDTASAWKVFAGYQTAGILGVEVSWLDLGTVRGRASGGEPEGELSTRGIALTGVARLTPGHRYELLLEAGLLHWQTDARFPGGPPPVAVDSSGDSFVWGAGGGVELGKGIWLRAEAVWLLALEDQQTPPGRADLVSLGVVYRF